MTLQQDRVAEDGVTKLLDLEASSRVQILSAPIQLPGVCGLCGTSRTDDRDYIDIGIWLEFYGQFYFCSFCMTEVTNRLGGYTPEQAAKIDEELNRARQEILDFQVEKAAVNDAINTLRATGLFDGPNLLPLLVLTDVVDKQDAVHGVPNTKNNELGITQTNNDTAESSSKQRTDGVSSTAVNGPDEWLL